MDLYVAAVRRPMRQAVSSHLQPGKFEPEPPYHAVARGRDGRTLCGEPVDGPLYAFTDWPYDGEPSYARCSSCESKAR